MATTTALRDFHAEQAAIAKGVYLASRTPTADMSDWAAALRSARDQIASALRASAYLSNVAAALQVSGSHTLVLRNLCAPPISQDQFCLICPTWIKQREKTGRPLPSEEAQAVADTFEARRSHPLTAWLDAGRTPTRREVQRLLWSLAPLIAAQQVQTIQRIRAATAQESAVIAMLDGLGWVRQRGSLLDTRAALPLRHYMHKTRYATASGTPQEVDLALGLGRTIVLAMECKVSNDRTNSVKRVNDVLKKATAWHTHWGSFVRTAALLQGVIGASDVWRLLDGGVEVFWSHELPRFQSWLDTEAR